MCENRSSRQQAFTGGLHKGNSKPVLIWLYEAQCEDDTGKPRADVNICLERSPIATFILLFFGWGGAHSSIIHALFM